MNVRKKITVAGYGTIGRFAHDTFAEAHDCRVYDPPQGLGSVNDLRDVDFVIVCVPTPRSPSGACDVSIVEDIVARSRVRGALIVHSTIAIGTTERLSETYRAPVVFSPEYAGELPEHPYRDRARRKFFIFGGAEAPAHEAASLYRSAFGPELATHVVPPRVAEMVKYMDNSFLATKVSFVNEFFDLCGAAGVPFEEVRRLWLADERIGESHTVVTAERGYGGRCLPKDVAAICAVARELGTPLRVLEAVAEANAIHRARGSRGATPESTSDEAEHPDPSTARSMPAPA